MNVTCALYLADIKAKALIMIPEHQSHQVVECTGHAGGYTRLTIMSEAMPRKAKRSWESSSLSR